MHRLRDDDIFAIVTRRQTLPFMYTGSYSAKTLEVGTISVCGKESVSLYQIAGKRRDTQNSVSNEPIKRLESTYPVIKLRKFVNSGFYSGGHTELPTP